MIELSVDGVNLYRSHRIVLENFKIGLPEPKLTTIDIPGRNGKLDMSEALTGYISYFNRELELVFGITGDDSRVENKRLTLMTMLASKVCRLKFSHLQGYFEGRCRIVEVTREREHLTVLVKCDCEPYRYLDQLFSQQRVLSSTPATISCLCLMLPVVPKIETTGQAMIRYKTSTYNVTRGMHHLPILFKAGNHDLVVSGSGSMTISYRQGVL